MVKEIVWTKRANKKFSKIIEYIEGDWGQNVAKKFVQKTYDVIELNSERSELGTLEHREKKIRGFLLTKHNRLFYRVTEKEIILLNFYDTRSGSKNKFI